MEKTFDRLGALDSLFLDTEHDDAPMHIGGVCLFAEPEPGTRRITLRKLRTHVEARLSLIPRYRQRLMRIPLEGHPVWVDSTDFRISDHVHSIALPAPSSPSHFEETVSWIFSRPLPRNRPLWEIWLIEDLPDGGLALVCKTHHCLADGLGGAALLAAILGTEPFRCSETPARWSPRPTPTTFDLLASAVDARVRGAASLTAALLSHGTSAPQTVLDGATEGLAVARSLLDIALRPPASTAFDQPTGTNRRFLWWSIALDDVKRIGRRLGGTVNDVALTLVSEAFARTSTATSPERNLRVFCPVGAGAASVSTFTLGNNVSGMFVDLPMEAADLKSRWTRVVSAAREGKASNSVQGAFLIARLLNGLSPTILSRLEPLMGSSLLYNLILTNVPGPQFPLYLFEQKMASVCPFVPLFRGQGLGIAIFSYAGTLTWGFHVDASRVDAARELRAALAAAAIRLAQLSDATVTAAQRAESAKMEAPARGLGEEPRLPLPRITPNGLHVERGWSVRVAS